MYDVVERCDFTVGDRIDRRYSVEKILGEGAYGKVFKVRDISGEIYAIKLLKLWEMPPEIRQHQIERFDMEFETGQIKSNYLIHSFSHGFTHGNPYIVMEFCSKGDLLQLINNDHADLPKIAKEVLYGLKDLHRCGKVHRDLKPENVLIKENGRAILTDFGISGDRNKRMTERNIWGKPTQIFGTYAYMPPEQVRPDKEATVLPTTDIFSFGVMMYQLITGELPFGELKDHDTLAIYLGNGREGKWNKTILNNSPHGQVFHQIISGCLVSDFRQRLQTVDAVLSLMPTTAYSTYKPASNGESMQANIVNGVLLRIMQGEEYGKVYKLDELIRNRGRIITIGYADLSVNNLLPITEEHSRYISRKHCTLEQDYTTRRWYIRDGQWDKNSINGWKRSLNGTFVNSTEVSKEGMPIRPGDIISIGDVKLRVEGY